MPGPTTAAAAAFRRRLGLGPDPAGERGRGRRRGRRRRGRRRRGASSRTRGWTHDRGRDGVVHGPERVALAEDDRGGEGGAGVTRREAARPGRADRWGRGRSSSHTGRWRRNRLLMAPFTSSDSTPRMADSRTAVIGSRPGRSAWPTPITCQSSDQSPSSEAPYMSRSSAGWPRTSVDLLVDGLVEVDDDLLGRSRARGTAGTVPAGHRGVLGQGGFRGGLALRAPGRSGRRRPGRCRPRTTGSRP